MAKKMIRVIIEGSEHLSAAHPTAAFSVPMNPTCNMWRIVVVGALSVNFAFVKKLKLTAITEPTKFARA